LPEGAIVMRPGAPTRLGEAAEMEPHLRALYSTVDRISGPGTIEGGDILVTGREILVGRSARTDAAGIAETMVEPVE
jgi:dimethylargininase